MIKHETLQAAAGDLRSTSQQESLPERNLQPSQAQPAGTALAEQAPSTAGDALLAAQLQNEDQVCYQSIMSSMCLGDYSFTPQFSKAKL